MRLVILDRGQRDFVDGLSLEFQKREQGLAGCFVPLVGGRMLFVFGFGPLEKGLDRLGQQQHRRPFCPLPTCRGRLN